MGCFYISYDKYKKDIETNNAFTVYDSSKICYNGDLKDIENELKYVSKQCWTSLPYNLIYRNCQHLACDIYKKFTNKELQLPNKKELEKSLENRLLK